MSFRRRTSWRWHGPARPMDCTDWTSERLHPSSSLPCTPKLLFKNIFFVLLEDWVQHIGASFCIQTSFLNDAFWISLMAADSRTGAAFLVAALLRGRPRAGDDRVWPSLPLLFSSQFYGIQQLCRNDIDGIRWRIIIAVCIHRIMDYVDVEMSINLVVWGGWDLHRNSWCLCGFGDHHQWLWGGPVELCGFGEPEIPGVRCCPATATTSLRWAWLIGRGWRVSVHGRSTAPGRLLHDRRHVGCQGEGRQAGSRGGRQVSDSNRTERLRGGVRRMVSSKMAKDMREQQNHHIYNHLYMYIHL